MTQFEVVAELDDISVARVLVTALKAHGFHPREGHEAGLPGMPGVTGTKGIFLIEVAEDEAADARILADALVADMQR